MLTNEIKKQILLSFLETIEGISDKKYQERVWILGEGPECDDFTETICHFFEEGDGILEKYKDFGINNKQYELLIKFRRQFHKFVKGPRPGYLPQEFIGTPEWEQITAMAKEVLKAFNYQSENKKQIIRSFLETIAGISNQKYQEQVWVLGEEPECDDFTETICRLIKEADVVLENYNDFGINNKQYELLIEFRNQLDKFVKRPITGSLTQEFIDADTHEWEKITEMAKEILKAFNYKRDRR